MRGHLLWAEFMQFSLMEVLVGKGLRITFWLERLSIPLSTMERGRGPTLPFVLPLDRASGDGWGRGLGRARCPGREAPCPHSPVAHNGCFLPMTFPKPGLYVAVSSPSPKGPGMGGISPALAKEPRSSHPALLPLLISKVHFFRSREWLPEPLSTGGCPVQSRGRGAAAVMDMAWFLRSKCLGSHPSNPTLISFVTLSKRCHLS